MSNEFVIEGTRPPSVLSGSRPGSAGRKHHGYHIRAKPSYVDESLFGSQHHTRLDEQLRGFKAPWEYPKPPPPKNTFATPVHLKVPKKPERKGRPLLWCPTPNAATHMRSKATTTRDSTNASSIASPGCLWNTRDHFRRLKHTPTFVDESLFGPRLQEPTFEAPWNERKKGEKRPIRPYLFDPSCNPPAQNGHSAVKQRPATALGISRADKRKQQDLGHTQQVWKP
ncbi:rbpj-interacting and tubulin-associated protein 1 [Plakobranchus ocellatus]|uniref:RBPJ-interacting and tubulin-associated protein 1 n=1 Tax=Plakobranchus ocellatus TaxID=259542 RepID=A0AAV3Z0G2_9GAST|nr:rbpj-interacting and tubulin-associated protein 1 [Plakobranchus ocellatus]